MMLRFIVFTLLMLPLAGCEQAEVASAAQVTANKHAYMDEVVRLKGRRVKRNDNGFLISTGRVDYVVLEDESGRIRVWYDIAKWRCPPRIGATLSAEGKVVASGPDKRRIFLARSMSIDSEPPLADNEVRMCQLSLNEQQIEAESGADGLRDYWRSQGKPEKVLIYE